VTALVLVGLMGAGKSHVGRLVAEEKGWRMVDVDAAITAETGLSVRQIWEAGGEPAYRHLESKVVLDTLRDGAPAVLAAPAGAVLDPAVRAALRGAFVIWLRTDPATLAGRVQPGDHRPLLGERPLDVFTTQAHDRSHLYEEVADAIIDTDHLDVGAVAEKVLELLPDP
jgi:shikimate kinase